MSKAMRVLFIVFATAVSGCTAVKSVKLITPTWFGMEPVAPGVYVDRAMPAAQRAEFRLAVENAIKQTRGFYGDIVARPEIYGCSTEDCYTSLGGKTARAHALGQSKLLLSPRGLTAPIISHEWSHAELYVRMGGIFVIRRIPQWFDDGVAVVVSEEPTHSEAVWRQIVENNVPYPPLDELVSLSDWLKAVKKYGDEQNTRESLGKLHVVYSTAGHEVRAWYQHVGRKGFLDLIEAVKDGADFQMTYERIASSATRSFGELGQAAFAAPQTGINTTCHWCDRSRTLF